MDITAVALVLIVGIVLLAGAQVWRALS